MASTPLDPKVLRGAIVAIDLQTSKQTTIAFQYYPDNYTLSRTITPAQVSTTDSNSRQTSPRYSGAPKESFGIEIMLDATDDLASGNSTAQNLGVYPQLYALEVLTYPQSQQVIEYDRLLKQGQMEVAGNYDAPLTLFVWGPQRVLPVQITSMTVTETIFDSQLNPIQAKIKLDLQALSYSDLDPSHKGYSLFLAYQKSKERQARQGATNGNATGLLGVNVSARLG